MFFSFRNAICQLKSSGKYTFVLAFKLCLVEINKEQNKLFLERYFSYRRQINKWSRWKSICWSFCRNFPEPRRDKFHRVYQWKKESAWGVATQSCFDISSLTSSVFRVFASKQPALSSATRNLTYWLRRKKRIAPRGTPVTEQHPPNRVRAERAMCFLSFASRLQNARWIGNKFEIYTPAGSNSAAHTPCQPNFYLCATKSWQCAPINKWKPFLGSFLRLTSRQTWPI
jgi:hypothetical protein